MTTDTSSAPSQGPMASPIAPDRRVNELLAHYGMSHQNPVNERIHYVAIPLIMVSLLGLMQALSPWLPVAFVLASLVYYARLSWAFFVTMLALSGVMLAVVHALGAHVLPVSLAVFVMAWVAQFVGHRIEGRKPSFLEDIQYLWVGPLFVLSRLFVKLGMRW